MSDTDLLKIKRCTLAQLISAGEAFLLQYPLVYGHGTDNAFDESAWLALEACGISPAVPLESYDIPVTTQQLERAKDWFKERAINKTPVAYITGRAWFAGLEFIVDSRALVPRSPIAELVHKHFQPWLSEAPAAVLDLCCGGGCIAIGVASVFPECRVDACDLSRDALDLAALNVQKHNLQNRVQLHAGDLFAPIQESRQYDLIVSNPPYVDAQDMHQLASEFGHEPVMGLEAGDDGLDIVERMLSDAKKYLAPDGVMIVEVGNSKQAVDSRFPELDLIWLDFEYGGDGVFLVNAQAL